MPLNQGLQNPMAFQLRRHALSSFVVDTDGTLAVRGKRGPWGFKPAIADVTEWLKRRFPAVQLDEGAADDDKHEDTKPGARAPNRRTSRHVAARERIRIP